MAWHKPFYPPFPKGRLPKGCLTSLTQYQKIIPYFQYQNLFKKGSTKKKKVVSKTQPFKKGSTKKDLLCQKKKTSTTFFKKRLNQKHLFQKV